VTAAADDPEDETLETRRTVRRCGRIPFRVRCPLRWEDLAPASDPDVRRCGECEEHVFFCRTDAETIEHALAGHCIAREEPDRSELPRAILGRPAKPVVVTARQKAAARWSGRERGISDAIRPSALASPRRCPECRYSVPGFRETCYVCGHALGRAT
jgi:hypothetical protein